MLSQLLDVLDEKKDADTLDALLDQNESLFSNLILYYYSKKELQKPQSASSSSASSPPIGSIPNPSSIDYTLQEKSLCNKIAKWTAMHEDHIYDCYNQVKSTAIDTFAITEIQIWNYVFEERQRMFTSLISMLDYVINSEDGRSQFANSIFNHINGWIHKGWKQKIVECYSKLTDDHLPDLPHHLRPKYCEYIAEEQLLLWKIVFLLYYEPIQAGMEDVDLFFKLYPLSLRKVIQRYMEKCTLPNAHESARKILEIMKKIDDLLIPVFMELLPIEQIHGHVEQLEFLVNEEKEIQNLKMNYKLAQPDALPMIHNKLEAAFAKSRPNNHLRNIWKIYSDIGYKLAKFMKLLDHHNANPDTVNIYEEIDKINNKSDDAATDAITFSNLINCFEKILITFGDCDDSKCFIKPMQCLIKSYLDAILLKDPEVLVSNDNIYYIYQHILSDNHTICNGLLKENKLERFALWKYAVKSFQTQPYLMLGLLSSLCSSRSTAQKVYQIFSHQTGYFTIKSQVEGYIRKREAFNEPESYETKRKFNWNFIRINKKTKGTIITGRDGHTQIMCWNTQWNGFLWLLSLLTHCIAPCPDKDKNNTESCIISKHNIESLSYNTLPSAMRLLTKLITYYPEAIQLVRDDLKLIHNTSSRASYRRYVSKREEYIAAHPPRYLSSLSHGGMAFMSFKLFTHCMTRLSEYDYNANSISNALDSTKDSCDCNLDLFCDATQFLKFMSNYSIEKIMNILHHYEHIQNDNRFFCKVIMTAIETLIKCIQNTNAQKSPFDGLAFEESEYQWKCVWNVIGYLIDIVNKVFIHSDILYFQEWNLDVTQYVHTLLSIYPRFYPSICFDIHKNDKTTLNSNKIALYYKATCLIYNICKYGDIGMVMNRFCDEAFFNLIIDPIIYSNEILTYFASCIRPKDQVLVNKIICESIKILENVLIKLNMDERQEVIIKIVQKLNIGRRGAGAFEQISLADKMCQMIVSLNNNIHSNVVNQCIKFLAFLCHIFPAHSAYPYQHLFNSMTEIERLRKWMSQYLDMDKWKRQSDIKKACNLVDLLCIFMSNQNRLRHLLLKNNVLLSLLFKIIKHKDSFTKYSHITAKCLHIFWLLHSDLDPAVYPFIHSNGTIWRPISDILSSDLQCILTDKRVESQYITRCWQNECYGWCFRILLQEVEQTLSFFDEIDAVYSKRRQNINQFIHDLTIEKQLLIKWMQIIVKVPGISVSLLKKRHIIAMDFRIKFEDFESDSSRLYGNYKDYGRNCVDKYQKVMNKLKLLKISADNIRKEKETETHTHTHNKRNYQDLNDIPYCIEVMEAFNLQKSLVCSHKGMLSAWSDLIQHICLCSPHILGLLPITCYNKKLSLRHLDATLNRIKSMTLQSKTSKSVYKSPSKRDLNQEESIKQLFHWNILRSLPKPKKQSKSTSEFTVKLSTQLNIAFKHMMQPQHFNLDENVLNCGANDLERHLSAYLSICGVLRDTVNHLTQDLDADNDTYNVLSFDLSKTIFVNIAECIRIASEFAANRSRSNVNEIKKQKLCGKVAIIDNICELLLMVAMVLIKWMLHYGPKKENNMETMDRPLFTKWKESIPSSTPIKKKLFFAKNENDNDNDSDDDVLIHNTSTMSSSSLSPNSPWFPAMSGCLQILDTVCSSSSHLIVHASSVAVSIFPYLIECISPHTDLSLSSIKQHGFINYLMNHFASISNHVVDAFIDKEQGLNALNKEYCDIKSKMFSTKSDEERLISLNNLKIVIEKEYVVSSFIPSIEKLSSILECFVSIAQESLDGAILLFENELLLYLTNCSIFKSNNVQFLEPYLVDSGEENPCHELWCKTLELITYLLRRTALALNSLNSQQVESSAMSSFIGNILKFCSVHHHRILNKIGHIAHKESYLRLRDLEEINIISSFIYEIEKNALLISQQSLDSSTKEFELHNERFHGLLQIMSKFIILLESPEMLSSLTPSISTHEKYAFTHINNKAQHTGMAHSGTALQRQRSKHIQWASDVIGGNSSLNIPSATVSIASDDAQDEQSPLPLGKLLKNKQRSVDTACGDDDADDAALRRDQFLQRIEYYILDVLKHILFCCRYSILDNWNHRKKATYLFSADLRSEHFLSASSQTQPHLSVLLRLSHYAITHLKGLYQTQLRESHNYDENIGKHTSILRRSKPKKRGDYMYDSKKVESEGIYHIVTWNNIEKTLWILFEHCYINLLLQIDCFLKSNEELVLHNIVQYTKCLDKLWLRITRFEAFLIENQLIRDNVYSFAKKEMQFIIVLREKQHHQLINSIERLRSKYMPHIALQRQSPDHAANLSMRSQPTSDTMTDITGATRRISNTFAATNQTRMSSTNYTPQSRLLSARSNVSSSWL